MPIKSFTTIYPKKKIDKTDEDKILAWIDLVIEKLENYEITFNSIDQDLDSKAQKVLEMKCFRCHANGNERGSFGEMENTEALINGKYVSKENPERSKLFISVRDGLMPPNKNESLSSEEQYVIRDWLEKVSKNKIK